MGELSEGHAKPLIPTGKTAHVPTGAVSRNAALKFGMRDKVHQLGEYHPALIHATKYNDRRR
jgi:hypothetical protein